jgi:hypothetical protein
MSAAGNPIGTIQKIERPMISAAPISGPRRWPVLA